MIYKLDRVARSMKELLVLLEDVLRVKGISLHILAGICASMVAEMERVLIDERIFDGLVAAEAQGRKGGRPQLWTSTPSWSRWPARRGRSVIVIAARLKIGRCPLYRALHPEQTQTSVVSDDAAASVVDNDCPRSRVITVLAELGDTARRSVRA